MNRLLPLLSLLLLASPALAEAPRAIHYRCSHGTTAIVTYLDDAVRLTYRHQHYRLPQASAASGARYEKNGVEWWEKGKDAMLTFGKEPALSCHERAPASR